MDSCHNCFQAPIMEYSFGSRAYKAQEMLSQVAIVPILPYIDGEYPSSTQYMCCTSLRWLPI